MGTAPFWYGDGSGGTLLDDMRYNYSSVYLRSSFEASEITRITEIILSVDYDDGFILWINGEEAFQMYAPIVPTYDAFSSDLHESGSLETYVLDADELDLEEGENLIAIQLFNANLESSDIHFNCALKAELAEPGLSEFPGVIPVTFSHISGYYNSPFNLSFSYENDSVELYYSLDGSHPGTSGSGVKYTPGSTILIDPASNVGRDLTPAVVVRTSFRKDGYKPSYPQSGSYIFPESVRYQRYPGGTWPSSNINSQVLDYALDVGISDG
ncbi:MAG: chitobiase/beta-hexosaminidase C-terminal domain-containing protein [Bacteroidales bacterium]|nr:chitobiase/beta-hexosaminidase C-terminal domain-containing protein [Bacteroidales bacterium]